MTPRVTDRASAGRVDNRWLISLDLPIEAGTPAEAVAQFWSFVSQLGPEQLPVYVSPAGDELAMKAYLMDRPTNLDPEEDELDEEDGLDPETTRPVTDR